MKIKANQLFFNDWPVAELKELDQCSFSLQCSFRDAVRLNLFGCMDNAFKIADDKLYYRDVIVGTMNNDSAPAETLDVFRQHWEIRDDMRSHGK